MENLTLIFRQSRILYFGIYNINIRRNMSQDKMTNEFCCSGARTVKLNRTDLVAFTESRIS